MTRPALYIAAEPHPDDCLCDACMGAAYGWKKMRFMRAAADAALRAAGVMR